MRVSLIVAASANHVIGTDGRLPWHLPNDLRYFRETTLGKPVLMGRRTWSSIGRPLPDRHNIVITRRPGFVAEGATIANSPAEALARAGESPEVMVIGGGQIYALFLVRAERIYLTRVQTDVDGDTYFFEPDEDLWTLRSLDAHDADERHEFGYEFRVYDRL